MPCILLGEVSRPLPPRTVAGLIRRARLVQVAIRLDESAGGLDAATVTVSKRQALALVRRQYGKGKRIDVADLFGALVIG